MCMSVQSYIGKICITHMEIYRDWIIKYCESRMNLFDMDSIYWGHSYKLTSIIFVGKAKPRLFLNLYQNSNVYIFHPYNITLHLFKFIAQLKTFFKTYIQMNRCWLNRRCNRSFHVTFYTNCRRRAGITYSIYVLKQFSN